MIALRQTMEEILPTRFSQEKGFEPRNSTGPGCLVRIYPVEGLGRVVSLDAAGILVGRDPGAQLILTDDSVSRRHAMVESTVNGDFVVDLESTNGTWINDVRVGRQKLMAGDRVRFGNQIFSYLSSTSLEAQYHESVYRIMTTDGLTQVYNKRFLLEVLDRELARARRRQAPLSLLMMDIDHFKSINDRWGHLAGDAVLTEFARRISQAMEGDELLARFGGEEFALVLPDTPLEEATQIAEMLRATVAKAPVLTEGMEIPVTVSIGVAEYSAADMASVPALLEAADQMLYRAKNSGRNQVQALRS